MGLTHHWLRPTELPAAAFKQAAEDCRIVFESVSAELGGFEGFGEPVLDNDHIIFNGKHPATCEPFEIAAVQFDRRGRDEFYCHCKTEHLPYDLFVKAALIIFSHRIGPAFKVTSDAPTAWDAARDLVQRTLGYGADFQLARE